MSGLGPCKKKLIGKYSFLSSHVLGQGYSGTVCLAKNEETGRFYALKIIEKGILKYQAHKSMILCQIQFLTLLKGYPNILNLQQVYNTKNKIYLFLELCNTDLKEFIRAKKTIPEPQAIEIMQKIIQGYGCIWKQKIIHRDLKPSNILLQDLQIKIADFGFSMFQKHKKEFDKINVGSPYYMPPQVLVYNSYSYQSDIWALGVIFYEMLAGRTPWKATTEKQLYKELKKLDITQIIPSNISLKSKEFLMRTLQLDPLKRMKPQEILQFKFFDQVQSIENELRISNRSQESILLQKSLRKSRIYHDPVQNTNPNPNHFNFEKNRKQIQVEDTKDRKFSDQKENEEIGMTMAVLDRNLAQGRMKAITNQENFDQVNELPMLPKKKKRIISRKNSLQTKCEIFQFDLINKTNQQISSQNALQTSPKKTKHIFVNEASQVVKNNINDEKKYVIRVINCQEPIQDEKSSQQDSENQKRSQEVLQKFSMILRSQIHFCRYIFKLLKKIMEKIPNELNLVRQELKEQMGALILVKLKKIQIEEIPDGDIFKEWLETKQSEKISFILKQYQTRYVMSLKDLKIPKEFDGDVFRKYLKKAILSLYNKALEAYLADQERKDKQCKTKVRRAHSEGSTSVQEEEDSQIMKMKEEIMILDQLITLRQLHKLDEKYGWETFEKRSRIESIVEGEPLEYIQKKHIVAISSKLGSLKII